VSGWGAGQIRQICRFLARASPNSYSTPSPENAARSVSSPVTRASSGASTAAAAGFPPALPPPLLPSQPHTSQGKLTGSVTNNPLAAARRPQLRSLKATLCGYTQGPQQSWCIGATQCDGGNAGLLQDSSRPQPIPSACSLKRHSLHVAATTGTRFQQPCSATQVQLSMQPCRARRAPNSDVAAAGPLAPKMLCTLGKPPLAGVDAKENPPPPAALPAGGNLGATWCSVSALVPMADSVRC